MSCLKRFLVLDFREKNIAKKISQDLKTSRALLGPEDAHDDLMLDLTKGLADPSKIEEKGSQCHDDNRIGSIPTERESGVFSNAIIHDKAKMNEDKERLIVKQATSKTNLK